MNPIIRNTLAIFAGIVIGSLVNMGLIIVGSELIPPPEGVIVADMESLKSSMHLFTPIHFIFPFFAHALGTLAGAFAASMIAGSHTMRFALTIGCVFLVGGIVNVIQLPAPLWFSVLDLGLSYIPMGWLGWKITEKFSNK